MGINIRPIHSQEVIRLFKEFGNNLSVIMSDVFGIYQPLQCIIMNVILLAHVAEAVLAHIFKCTKMSHLQI